MVIYSTAGYYHEDDPYAGPHCMEYYAKLEDAEKRVLELQEIHRTATERYAAFEKELLKLLSEAGLERYGTQTERHRTIRETAKQNVGIADDWDDVFNASQMGPFRPFVREVTVK